jgi:uncharacterized protein YqhQ
MYWEGIKMTQNKNSEYDSSNTSPKMKLLYWLGLIKILLLPFYLLLFAAIGFSLWKISIMFFTVQGIEPKIVYGVCGLLLLIIGYRLSISTKRLVKRVYSGIEKKK